ncbi:MAG TPA: indolepyruvate/phenylpyruvate decarboxylase [Usitatibacteraceae bacterium]|nr:indolepyruvate/phenylpyruvate decarboxylase [Usitatibacteraceae bacterium]
MNLVESLLHALKAHGGRQIFGIPGDFALPFFKIAESSGILPLYALSHEPSLGFAADAAARIQGTIGIAAVTYGAGALNMVNAVAGAYAEKSPLVVISGGPGKSESAYGLLLHHQVKRLDSQFEIFREITCAQTRLDNAQTAPAEIARVLARCIKESRPVYIEVPRDMAGVSCDPVQPLPPVAVDPRALDACVDEILAGIARAKSPVMMVGVEVRRFGEEDAVAELAHRLDIPVVTSFMGMGLLAESSNPPLGAYMGLAGNEAISDMVENSDRLLMLGVILSDTNFGASHKRIDLRRAILVGDGQVELGFHIYHDIPFSALIQALLKKVPPRSSAPRAAPPVPAASASAADGAALKPLDIAQEINALMRRHGRYPLAVDVGDCLFASLDIDHTHRVAPGYYASMGFAVPAGIGLQAATGQRAIVLVGDGAFQMTGMELGNCARYGWDPIVIVFNNSGWGMLQSFEPNLAMSHLGTWGFASMAEGLGGQGVRVNNRAEFAAALEQAAGTRGRFQLIEAIIPAENLSPTLARFVDAVKRVSASPAGAATPSGGSSAVACAAPGIG